MLVNTEDLLRSSVSQISQRDKMSSKIYIDLFGRTFENPPVGYWYNLMTGIKVKKTPKGSIALLDPRVTGPPMMLDQFLKNNQLSPRKWAPEESTAFTRGLCTPGGSALFRLETTDIEEVPKSALETLCNFTMIGLRVKANVMDIIDADTIDVVFFLPTKFLTQSHLQGRGKNIRVVQTGLVFEEDRGFVVRYRCRLNGIDAAEKNTLQGKKATELTREKYGSLNNIIYILTTGMDKYGRLLIEAYEDSSYQVGLNRFLVGYTDPELGVLVEPYSGGTKSEYMKCLPVE